MYATTAITDEVDVDRFRRDSNVLRASVFDAAMLLGVGSSRTLQNWIFDGDGDGDADDEDDIVSPSKPAGRMKSIYREDFDAATLASYIFDRDAGGGSLTPRTPPTPSSSGLTPAIRLASAGTARSPRNKLRKPRFAVDESEAEDGSGYATDGRVVARPGNSRRSSRVTVSTNNTAPTSATKKKRDKRMSRSYDIVNAVEADAEADEEGYGYLSDGAALAARRAKGSKKSGTMPSSFFRLLVPRPSAPSSQLFISSPQPLGRGSVAIDRPRSRISIGESVQMHARSVTPRSREGVRTRTGSAGESSSGTETPEPRTPSSGVASVRSRTRRA